MKKEPGVKTTAVANIFDFLFKCWEHYVPHQAHNHPGTLFGNKVELYSCTRQHSRQSLPQRLMHASR